MFFFAVIAVEFRRINCLFFGLGLVDVIKNSFGTNANFICRVFIYDALQGQLRRCQYRQYLEREREPAYQIWAGADYWGRGCLLQSDAFLQLTDLRRIKVIGGGIVVFQLFILLQLFSR